MSEHGRVVGYLRVSTDKQEREGNGHEYQRRAIEVYCARHSLTLVDCMDDTISGSTGGAGLSILDPGDTDMHKRPGLIKCMAALQRGQADGIIVWKLDRLARDVVVQEILIRDFWKHGWRIHSCDDTENHYLTGNVNDPTRELVRTILSAVAQYERKMIGARMAAGRAVKIKEQGYIGGAIAYGKMADADGKIVPNPAEIPILERVSELRHAGHGYKRIAKTLEDEGMVNRDGRRFSPETIKRMIARTDPNLVGRLDG